MAYHPNNPNGQATMDDSAPVVIASDQSAVPVSMSSAPLPSGAATEATLLLVQTAVEIMDDWDESDRAKVNPIVGQAGVAAGSGASGVTTQRVITATDSPDVTALQIIDDWDESDRAKVNIIVGQAGITAGAGAVAANTPRVTHASDDPVVTALQIMDDWDNAASDGCSVSGDVAHDAVDAGEPVKIGAKAIAHGSAPTAVAAADRTDLYANRHGILFHIGGHPNIVTKEFNFTTSQTNVALATISSGMKLVVTRISILNNAATSINVGIRIGFAAATLSAASSSGVTGIVVSHPGLAPGSGVVEGTGAGMLGVGADGEDLRITSDAPTSGSIRVVVSYYEIES